MSGGLDSALAARLMLDQGIEVVGLHLESPFGCILPVDQVAAGLGIRLIKVKKGEAYLDLVKNPKFGYGKNMNPCLDCRIYMFQLAETVLDEEQADFVVTGEVMGQRPMSQMKSSMELIDSRTTLKGRLLRPLSAQVMEATIPELEGWVDREKLLSISGRGRKDQLRLAEALGVEDYSAPGGGCLLTEAAFSNRLRDFFGHEEKMDAETRLAQSKMLRLGRHFRVRDDLKIIIGRNESENVELAQLWRKAGAAFMHPESFKGPDAVAIGRTTFEDRELIGQIIIRYGKTDAESDQRLRWDSPAELLEALDVSVRGSIADDLLDQWRL